MKDKVAFISGGTSGINLGIAQLFVERGASVLIFGRDADRARQAAESLRSLPGARVMEGSADVRDAQAVSELFQKATSEFGNPNIVIAGAAGNFKSLAAGMSYNAFKTVVDIDLLGTFNVFRAAYDLVRKPGSSMIAISAPQGANPRAYQAHVCAAKAGVNMLVKCLALEWGQAGIRVNAISPGPIAGTEGVNRIAPTDQEKEAWRERISMRRFGSTRDIAEAAAYLCSDAGGFVNGSLFDCDGGSHLGDASGDFLTVPKRVRPT